METKKPIMESSIESSDSALRSVLQAREKNETVVHESIATQTLLVFSECLSAAKAQGVDVFYFTLSYYYTNPGTEKFIINEIKSKGYKIYKKAFLNRRYIVYITNKHNIFYDIFHYIMIRFRYGP